ncbi:hypothetical protein DCAR_0207208 [Daucus carota subsp. sativus]|uniref:Uncharacterized protein n=1 Tax=Daucus carota subsp. sativus TaxID=79200 RepID=A0AAF1APV6_DAUCS|nr:hypothetical protein DCAR_0207208 [Daucus carota subsp. sativus]
MQCIRKYVAKRYMNPVLLRKLHHMRTRTRFNKLSGMEPDNATEESGADQYHRYIMELVLLTGRELCLLHRIDRLHASER